MPREKIPLPDTTGEIPAWFMTYSDVITLLMTFFILLLTFASQEPENFDRVKVSMFGGGGSDGVAGRKDDALDRESVMFRYRPDISRLTQHGSETPPTEVDAAKNALNEGLKALEKNSDLVDAQRLSFFASHNSIIKRDGSLTKIARQRMAAISKQLIRFPSELSIIVPNQNDLPAAVEMAYRMTYDFGVTLGRVSVATRANSSDNRIQFLISRKR